MKLPRWATTVTPFSRGLALLIFTLFPILGFFLGVYYQKSFCDTQTETALPTNMITTPTLSPPDATSDEPPNIGTYKGVEILP